MEDSLNTSILYPNLDTLKSDFLSTDQSKDWINKCKKKFLSA